MGVRQNPVPNVGVAGKRPKHSDHKAVPGKPEHHDHANDEKKPGVIRPDKNSIKTPINNLNNQNNQNKYVGNRKATPPPSIPTSPEEKVDVTGEGVVMNSDPQSPGAGQKQSNTGGSLSEETKRRQQAVREAYQHAFKSYEKYVWGQDELKPKSRSSQNWMGMVFFNC